MIFAVFDVFVTALRR